MYRIIFDSFIEFQFKTLLANFQGRNYYVVIKISDQIDLEDKTLPLFSPSCNSICQYNDKYVFSCKDKAGATPNIHGKSISEILDEIKDESGLVLEITKYNIRNYTVD